MPSVNPTRPIMRIEPGTTTKQIGDRIAYLNSIRGDFLVEKVGQFAMSGPYFPTLAEAGDYVRQMVKQEITKLHTEGKTEARDALRKKLREFEAPSKAFDSPHIKMVIHQFSGNDDYMLRDRFNGDQKLTEEYLSLNKLHQQLQRSFTSAGAAKMLTEDLPILQGTDLQAHIMGKIYAKHDSEINALRERGGIWAHLTFNESAVIQTYVSSYYRRISFNNSYHYVQTVPWEA